MVTKDSTLYTVWVNGAIITGFLGDVHEASKLGEYWHARGYADVVLMPQDRGE